MIRLQIQLDERQLAAVRRAAAAGGVSVAAVVRELVDSGLTATEDAREARARAVVGAFASGLRTTSAEHDAALDRAYAS